MFTLSITLLLKSKGGELLSNLLENIISLLFPALKVIFQVLDQAEILAKSLLSCPTVSAGSFPLASKEQSSAKIVQLDLS